MENFMNGLEPNCLDDFLFSNPEDRTILEMILSRKMPFPFKGVSGILLHGTWGTGKSTLAQLLYQLLEKSYSNTWDISEGAGQMPAFAEDQAVVEIFRCGGGLSSSEIKQKIQSYLNKYCIFNQSKNYYFVFDEVDRLTSGAQLSLRSNMDRNHCMYFFTTNYLNKIDTGIINRCHLIEMNQISDVTCYEVLGQKFLQQMGLSPTAVSKTTLHKFALDARGSMRLFYRSLSLEGLKLGGVMPSSV